MIILYQIFGPIYFMQNNKIVTKNTQNNYLVETFIASWSCPDTSGSGLVGVRAAKSEVWVTGVSEGVLRSSAVEIRALLCSGVRHVGVDRVAGEFSTEPFVRRPCRHRLSASRLLSWSLTFVEEEDSESSELATEDLLGLMGTIGEVGSEGRGRERGSTPELVALLRLVSEPSESSRGMAVVVAFGEEMAADDTGEVWLEERQGLGSPRTRSSSVFMRRSRTNSRPISQSNLEFKQ